jgi:hypothetical protein
LHPQPVRTPTGPGFSRARPEPDPTLQGGSGLGFDRPEPSQAEPEPGLSSRARARKTLVVEQIRLTRACSEITAMTPSQHSCHTPPVSKHCLSCWQQLVVCETSLSVLQGNSEHLCFNEVCGARHRRSLSFRRGLIVSPE